MASPPEPVFANGKICYLEIPAIHVDESAAFYQTVFGWQIRKDNHGFTSFDDTTGQVSGMWVTGWPAATTPGLLISIMVTDITSTIAAIQANGGQVLTQPDLNAGEVLSRFSDPAGNVLCLYQHQG